MTQVARNKKAEFSQHESNRFDSDFFFRAACVTNTKKIVYHVSPGLKFTISLKIIAKNYFQLTKLHWKIFCCITSYDCNSKKRFGHVTSPELKMADRDVRISHCNEFVFLSISTLI